MFFNQELIVIFTAAAPISELRGAIPLGLLFFKMGSLKVFLLSVFGNMLPVLPLMFFLGRFSGFLMERFYFWNRFFSWLFEYTRRRHSDHFHYWSWAPLALLLFVAVPLPLTGAWSGALAAFIFGIPYRVALPAIFLGVVLAGLIVLAGTAFGVYAVNSI